MTCRDRLREYLTEPREDRMLAFQHIKRLKEKKKKKTLSPPLIYVFILHCFLSRIFFFCFFQHSLSLLSRQVCIRQSDFYTAVFEEIWNENMAMQRA